MQGQGERVYHANIEGVTQWNIPQCYWLGRAPGLSAMVRVKDEAEWIKFSLDSVVDWCDEVAVFLQGVQTDGTDKLVEAWAAAHPDKARVHYYPFESRPNGPGHELQPRGSVHERAYFYNWCHAKTRFSHAMKWDGDMVAHDWLGGRKAELMEHAAVRFRGVDLAGYTMQQVSVKPQTANEPRVWKVASSTFFYSGHKCEYFTFDHADGHDLGRVAYVHLKWVKADLNNSRKDWPVNWRKVPHFQRIDRRQNPGGPYTGDLPRALVIERQRRLRNAAR